MADEAGLRDRWRKKLAERRKLLAVARKVHQRALESVRAAKRVLARHPELQPKPKPAALSVFGLDYAWGARPYDAFKKAGAKFVMRYVSHDRTGKNLTADEIRELHRRGIKVGVVFEDSAGRATAGFNTGQADAAFADSQVRALGLDGIPIYFAADWDVTPAQKPLVADYLRGCVRVLGSDRVGVYGGYHVVKYMADHNVCRWFWQTYAWSGGLVHPATHIYQYRNGQNIGGLSVDFNKATDAPGGFGAR